MLYVPGRTELNVNAPAWSVSASRRALVSSLTSVTFAPATTASVGSVTVPLIVPLVLWPQRGINKRSAAGIQSNRFIA
jgi:hypothetical protein